MFRILKGKRCYDFDVEERNWNKINSNRHEICLFLLCVVAILGCTCYNFNGNAEVYK